MYNIKEAILEERFIPESVMGTAGMKKLIKEYLDDIMMNHYPLFVTEDKLKVIKLLLTKKAKHLKETVDLSLPENKAKHQYYLLLCRMIDDAKDLEEVIDNCQEADAMTQDYLERFTPD